MNQLLITLKKTPLFKNLTDEEILSAINCLNGQVSIYSKETIIINEGDVFEKIGIIIIGEVEIEKNDYKGNVNIISRLFASDLLGASIAFSQSKIAPFTVISKGEAKILWLSYKRLINPCQKSCFSHHKIIENMLEIIASKNLELSNKIDVLTKRSIREKVLSFLYQRKKKARSSRFAINLTRTQLADYLSVNRSALIRELSAMKKEGLIDFDNNIFRFLEDN